MLLKFRKVDLGRAALAEETLQGLRRPSVVRAMHAHAEVTELIPMLGELKPLE